MLTNQKRGFMFRFGLSMFIMFLTTGLFASEFSVKNYKRYIELIGVVDSSALEIAEDINNLAVKSNEEITLLINSPGGSVTHGMIVMDSIHQAQLKGVRFKCLSPVLAASMAYIIFAQCDERYAFSNSLLLWHQISVSMKGAKLKPLYDSLLPLLDLQRRVDRTLRIQMRVSKGFYDKHSEAETLWSAFELRTALRNNDFLNIIQEANVKTENLYRYMKSDFNIFGQTSTGFDDVDRILKRISP